MKLKSITLLFLCFFLLIPTVASAEKGDFYDKYKSEFDSAPLSETTIDVIKAYDPDTNSFECGTFAISCSVVSLQYGLAIGLMNFVADGTQILMLDPSSIVTDAVFVKFKNYMDSMSTTLLALFLVWQIMVGVARRYGDPDDTSQLLHQKILQVFAGATILALYEQIFTIILGLQKDVSNAILSAGLEREQLTKMVFLYSDSYSIFFTIFLGLMFIIFLLALVYRFVALGFFYVVGPVAIPTIVNEEFNYFQIWLRYVVNNVVTFIMQCMAFSLSLAAITNQFSITKNLPWGIDMVVGSGLAMVFCLFALVIPGILGNLGSSTGTGRALGKIIRYAAIKR